MEAGSLALYCAGSAEYNLAGSGAVYHLAGKIVFRYGNLSLNRVEIILDGPNAEMRDHNDNDILASCSGTGATGSFTLLNGDDLITNSDFNNAGTLNPGTGILGGAGNFSSSANSSLVIGSADGITLNDASGNIQKTGSRGYSEAANYTYQADVMQNCGDGLPQTVRSLTVDNPQGLDIGSSLCVTHSLSLIQGVVSASLITLGSSVSAGILLRDQGYLAADFCQWLESTHTEVLFPVGSPEHYRPLSLSFDAGHSNGGSLCLSTIYADPGNQGLPLMDDGAELCNISREAYWRLEPDNGLQSGGYSIGILASGFAGINDYSGLHLVQRSDDQNPWQLSGIHIPSSGSNAAPLVGRSGLSDFGEFALSSTAENFQSLATVQNLQINTGGPGVQLSWEAVSGATGYTVYAADDPYASFPEAWSILAEDVQTLDWSDPAGPNPRRFYLVTGSN